LRKIAETFVTARVGRRSLAEYPGPFPKTLDEAYAIQLEAIGMLGRAVKGWKVARLPADIAAKWRAERIAGPIFDLWDANAGEPEVPLFEGGYAAAEAELQLRIRAIPQSNAPDIEETVQAIGTLAIGIEAAGSPYAGINAHGPAVTVSDFGNNAGLALGPPIAPPLARRVSSLLNGKLVGEAVVTEPFEAACFLFGLGALHGLPLSPGQWISAGAITGAHPVGPGDRFEARFGGEAVVACHFTS
jgi:2-keto-4-pentenoate hydratase